MKVAGLGLRAAWFVCPILHKEIRPGRRVVIHHPVARRRSSSYQDEYEVGVKREVKATITTSRPRAHQFASVLDPGQITEDDLFEDTKNDAREARWRKTQAHHRIVRFLDEPDAPVCSNGNVVRAGLCEMKDRTATCDCKVQP